MPTYTEYSHQWYMDLCYNVAQMSHDPRTQNGAILLCEDGEFVGGLNDLPKDVETKPTRLESPEKYYWIEHAERGALYFAVSQGMDVRGSTLYCPWAACADCGRAIAMMGVSTLIRHKQAMNRVMDAHAHDQWAHSIEVGDEIMRARGVDIIELDYVSESVIDLGVRFNREIWHPQNP